MYRTAWVIVWLVGWVGIANLRDEISEKHEYDMR